MKPISPYLSVYKPQIGSMFSIFCRISGIFIFLFLLISIVLKFLSSFILSFYFFYSFFFFFFKSLNFLILTLIYFFVFNVVYHIMFSLRFLTWSTTTSSKILPISLKSVYMFSHLSLLIIFLVSSSFWVII